MEKAVIILNKLLIEFSIIILIISYQDSIAKVLLNHKRSHLLVF